MPPTGKRKIDVVDLTSDDNSRKAIRTPAADSRGQRLGSSQDFIDLSQAELSTQAELEDERNATELVDSTQGIDDDAYSSYVLYGALNSKIVGVRYYNGRATIGECVTIRREPQNHYDRNAIRIDNVMGNQVGHIPRNIASKLAPYLDSKLLFMEGRLTGNIGAYDCPIAISMYGTNDIQAQIDLMRRMKNDRLPVSPGAVQAGLRQTAKQAREDMERARVAQAQQQGNFMLSNLSMPGEAGENAEANAESLDDLVERSTTFNPREMGQVVERFGVDETELAKMPMADCPVELSTELLPYQRQGLAWMIEKESPKLPEAGSDDVVQLWKRAGATYRNIATNYSTQTPPPLASGGILADDMGLGKTIQIISLILANSKPRTPRSSKATLIVSPLGVMTNWRDQIASHIQNTHALKVLKYHGAGKKEASNLAAYDVVITTYGAIASEYGQLTGINEKVRKTKKGVFSVHWRRVVLDEGHTIRTPRTQASRAASALPADSRWSLTGTPIVNNLKDLYSQIRFLKISGGLEDFAVFNSALIRPLNAGNSDASLILQALMATICLRRKKDMSFINLRLPPMTSHILHVKFQPHEKEKYDMFLSEAQGVLRDYQSNDNKGSTTYSHVLEVILRLRQVCNHWKLCQARIDGLMSLLEKEKVVKLTPENVKALQALLQLKIESQEDCAICLDGLKEPVITNCAHTFDRSCIEQAIERQHKCPLCRAEIQDGSSLVAPATELGEDSNQIEIDPNATSSKIEGIIKILAAKGQAPGTKTVVFSQWTSFLDLIEPQLAQNNINFARIDGKMNSGKRDAALTRLNDDPECTVMLASLNVCSVGLNLVAANQVILADTWWAPAIEDQAVDRVYRLGQKRPTTVWRLVVEESIEDRVLGIQDRKRKLMSTAFREKDPRKVNDRRERLADLESLIG